MSVFTLVKVVFVLCKSLEPTELEEGGSALVRPELCQNYFLSYLREKIKVRNLAVVV